MAKLMRDDYCDGLGNCLPRAVRETRGPYIGDALPVTYSVENFHISIEFRPEETAATREVVGLVAGAADFAGAQVELFPEGADQKRARAVCMGCVVRSQCLAEALDNRIEWGVWGGMTERERRQLLRQRTDISSWQSVLCGKKGK